jgi:general secretion pathway protein C
MNHNPGMTTPRWTTLAVWAQVAASAVYWGLQLFVAARDAPPRTQMAQPATVAHGDLARLLGADAPPPAAAPEPAADARYQLIGVVSPRAARAGREGLALIAVDGKPAKAFRVGAVVDGQTVLKSVSARGAMLGMADGVAGVTLNIPPPAPAATGALPGATAPFTAPVAAPPAAVRPGFPPQLPQTLRRFAPTPAVTPDGAPASPNQDGPNGK